MLLPLPHFSARKDENIGIFLRPSALLALTRRFAPHALGPAQSAALAAFAAAVRVIHWVHRGAAHRGAHALPARPAGLAVDDEPMLFVGHFADRGPAGAKDAAHFGRGHFEVRVALIVRDNFGEIARRARELAAIARLELDVVDERADRDFAERQAIARCDRRAFGDEQCVAHLDLLRQKHVALLAVAVDRKTDECTAERIVFDARDPRRNVLLVEIKINETAALFVPAALVSHGDTAPRIAPAHALFAAKERLVRTVAGEQLPVVERRHAAEPWGRGFVFSDAHGEWLLVGSCQLLA